MNKSESKYFHTAAKMDVAFLKLLEKKEIEYITVKEICEKAGVNRSTFYLHYETVSDIISECVEYITQQFFESNKTEHSEFLKKIQNCSTEELYLITPEYLSPYLSNIKQNQRLFQTMLKNASALRLEDSYFKLFRYVFTPILDRFQVPHENREYMMAFYIHGLIAIITEWLKQGCRDSVEHIIAVMQQCVLPAERFDMCNY